MSSAPEAESASSASSMPQFDEPGGIRPVMTSYDQGGAQYGLARNFKMNTGDINLEGGLVADNSDDEGDEQDYDIRDHWSRFSMGRGRSSSGLKMSGPRRNSNSSSSSGSRGPFTSYLPASWTQRDPPQIHGLYQNTGKPRKMGSGSHYTTFDPSEGIERRAQMREGESVALLHKEHDRQRWQRTCISSAVFFILGLVVTLYLVWFYRNQYSSSSSSTGSL